MSNLDAAHTACYSTDHSRQESYKRPQGRPPVASQGGAGFGFEPCWRALACRLPMANAMLAPLGPVGRASVPSRSSARRSRRPPPALAWRTFTLPAKRMTKLEAGGVWHSQPRTLNVQGALQQGSGRPAPAPAGRYPLLQAAAAEAGCKAAPTPTEFAGQLSSFH